MTIGAFNTSIANSKSFLKSISLFRKPGVKEIGEVSQEFKTASQKGTYFNTYTVALKNLDFDFLLNDESFFQFSYKSTEEQDLPLLRYAFFKNPRDIMQYEEYLLEEIGVSYNDAGDMFIEEYSQYITEAELNSDATPIRYDLDYKGHHPLVHATSHFHIGNAEHIRIPCNKIITPLCFVIFIVKHLYFSSWKEITVDLENLNQEYISNAKALCKFIKPAFWKHAVESKELFLT